MSSTRIWAVIKREVRVRLGKGFIIGTILIPILMGVLAGVQILLANMKQTGHSDVTVAVAANDPAAALVRETLEQSDIVKNGFASLSFVEIGPEGLDAYLETRRRELLRDNTKSVFWVPSTARTDKKIAFYSANTGNMELRSQIGAAVNKALNLNFFASNQIGNVDIQFIQTDVEVAGNKVSASGTQSEGWGPVIVGFALAILLLLGISFNAMPVVGVVVTEKANRIYEVLLSSLRPRDLLWGKVAGITVTATLQMFIWVASFVAIALVLNNFVDVAGTFKMEIRPFVLAYYLVNYVTGLLIFLSLYSGLSAMFDNPNSAGTALMPVYMLILLPFYTVFSLASNPANAAAEVLSMAPLTSLYVMPARMTLLDVPVWQPLIALAGNLAVFYFVSSIAGKVYRLSILSTGNKPSLRQLVIWARHA